MTLVDILTIKILKKCLSENMVYNIISAIARFVSNIYYIVLLYFKVLWKNVNNILFKNDKRKSKRGVCSFDFRISNKIIHNNTKCKQRDESQGEGRCTCISITIEFQQCGYVLCSSILPVCSELGISKKTHFKKLKACFPPF